ncbi:MAG: methylmalonyl Co-A mutase-associated GTPase MeaB [Chitinophagaceae bacterium]|nr:methylmalonyl Co-A mutase-associated GTPase MeaB [Chitinophagaceae bacterium]
MSSKFTVSDYREGLLRGNVALLSRAITLIESTRREDKEKAAELIDSILPYSGQSVRVGITGVPGVGKSTFIEAFGMHLLRQQKKLAVLAIDPSSSISKGSILGDKTRMEQLSVQKNAFIRPSASSGSLGGVTYKTYETILLCEAAGFDTILVETVGVGQSETEVSHICDFFLLLMLAGAGDELQGIKRGIMELADGVVITKADGSNSEKAKAARSEYARALHFLPGTASGWMPEVLTCSAYEGTGIEAVADLIGKYCRHQESNGFFREKRVQQNVQAFQRLLQEELRNRLLSRPGFREKVRETEAAIAGGRISPYTALQQLLDA